jgi:hypothetical protein
MVGTTRTPRTKEQLLDKALSFDAGMDFRSLASNVQVQRLAPHIVRLSFPDTGGVFDLTVHIPREAHRQAKEPIEHVWEADDLPTTRRSGRGQ